MRWTQTLIPTLREDPKDAEAVSHKLMLRAGLIRKLSAGIYTYLPLGMRILEKVVSIIREEMFRAGADCLLMPALHPAEIWKRTGRYETLGADKFAFKNRTDQEYVLGPTHEEVITELAGAYIKSYKDLPKILFQIQTKFRDELRPRFGIIRTKEFIMKDAYSFDRDEKGLDQSYQKMFEAYKKIFTRCGMSFEIVSADPGLMGGKVSQEFMVESKFGEDVMIQCPKCGYTASQEVAGDLCPQCRSKVRKSTAMEIGHVFKLGTRYTKVFGVEYSDEKGEKRTVIMGCYGIGVNRILAAHIEEHHDTKGMIWSKALAPYQVLLLNLNQSDSASVQIADKIYESLIASGLEVLYDDRDERAGVKFNDADLIGIPLQIIVSERNLKDGKLEIVKRADKKTERIDLAEVSKFISETLSGLS